MRLKSLDLAVAEDLGLRSGSLAPLGELVVLAGPNGAGKSRVLATVKSLLSDPRLGRDFRTLYLPYPEKYPDLHRKFNSFTYEGDWTKSQVFDFFPTKYVLRDHRRLTPKEEQDYAAKVREVGVEDIHEHALSYISTILRRAFTATHPDIGLGLVERESAIQERERLRGVCKELLGADLGYDLDQQPTLFGRPIPESSLSRGQTILLQLAVALHAQATLLNGAVLLVDEPENHLHPSSAIAILDHLRRRNPSGQMWVATHSVPILAAMPPECIWYLSQGRASWAGRSPEHVLNGLLGGQEGCQRVADFLRLPAQLASNRFAAECLTKPAVVDTGSDDPQAKQLRDFCQTQRQRAPLRVLDYGAGRARLLIALADRVPEGDFTRLISYQAYEPFPDPDGMLSARLEAVYGKENRPRLLTAEDQLETLDQGSVDIVVMCNVLHEIPPRKWTSLFGKDGAISRMLAEDGHVLILEDMEMPHGELAHEFGFLLLDNPHLHKLFACHGGDTVTIKSVTAYQGRLSGHAIPAKLCGRTTHVNVLDALQLLQKTARQKIANLRKGEPSARNGRLHALWTQLLANADLGLQDMH